MVHGRALTSGWYAEMLGAPCESIDAVIGRSRLHRLGRRFGFLRGLLIFRAARSYSLLALVHGHPGTGTVTFLEAWLRRRRQLVLLELIGPSLSPQPWRRWLKSVWFRVFERPAVARTLRVGHVLTDREVAANATRYRLPLDRVRFVPWAWCREGGPLPSFDATSDGVLASGREHCDWEMVFGAAQSHGWPLTVICSDRDLGRVQGLNGHGRATVLSEVSRETHNEKLRSAAVYVLPLLETGRSAGQVRLASAVEEGAPVVATAVTALDGYVEPGRTALVVEPGNAAGLGRAVQSLLDSPEDRQRLREAAIERARGRTYADYFSELRSLIEAQL